MREPILNYKNKDEIEVIIEPTLKVVDVMPQDVIPMDETKPKRVEPPPYRPQFPYPLYIWNLEKHMEVKQKAQESNSWFESEIVNKALKKVPMTVKLWKKSIEEGLTNVVYSVIASQETVNVCKMNTPPK